MGTRGECLPIQVSQTHFVVKESVVKGSHLYRADWTLAVFLLFSAPQRLSADIGHRLIPLATMRSWQQWSATVDLHSCQSAQAYHSTSFYIDSIEPDHYLRPSLNLSPSHIWARLLCRHIRHTWLAISWYVPVCTFPCELLCSAVPLVSRTSGCSLWTAACSHSVITEVQLPARSEGEGEKR